VEIGATFLRPERWRTAINTECKRLLLTHAFEVLRAQRVCLKTDARNRRSARALERIAARREGTLRNHLRTRGGVLRDTTYFSVVKNEWPAVRARLRRLLQSDRSESASLTPHRCVTTIPSRSLGESITRTEGRMAAKKKTAKRKPAAKKKTARKTASRKKK
jgi:hypothetical protein